MVDPGTRRSLLRSGAALVSRLLVVVLVLAVGAGSMWLARAAVSGFGGVPAQEAALPLAPAPVRPGAAAPAGDRLAGVAPGNPREPEDEDSGGSAGTETEAAEAGTRTLAQWAGRLGDVVDIPQRALVAYGNAELAMRAERPECHLSWATLAGIGRIESDHGRYGGAALREDGRPSEPIIGIALDGSTGVKAIADTDDGRLDGDPRHDRAVGPMQFIPSTWSLYGVDASGDGVADPQQIDDAALSAARYLCRGGRDLTSAQGWWDGVLSYNSSTEYGRTVFGLADGYAKRARAGTG